MNRKNQLTKFEKSHIFDLPCMSISDFNYSNYDKGFSITKENLEPYILPEDVKLKYRRDSESYNIEYVMQAGTLSIGNSLHISIFRAVRKMVQMT